MNTDTTHTISKYIASKSANLAHKLGGWKKWLLSAVAALAGAIAWFTQTQSPATIEASPPDTHGPTP